MSADAGRAPVCIGRFQIRREIGRGTMGVVYEAHDPVLGRTVALKTIALAVAGAPAERAAFEDRFLAEARIAARLSHPGIVVVHEVGRDADSGTLYMALEHLSGRTLEELIAEGRPVEWREALRILGRLAAALDHAHDQAVVHRDVKPANVMLLDSGDLKIMDFGIAKLVVDGNATSTGQLLGTPLYMAPEQARAELVDARTDIFSLGAIAYSLLTGRRAFQAGNIATILARVLHHDPPPPSGVVAGLPPAVDDLVARAMAKTPTDRYPTAKALGEDVDDILAGRPPRHRAGWTAPPVGASTLLSGGVPRVEPEDLELIEGPPPASESRGRVRSDSRPRFLAMILLGGGIGIAAAGLLRFEVLAPEEPGSAPSSPRWLPSPYPGSVEPGLPAPPAEAPDLVPPSTVVPEIPEALATEPPPSAETRTAPSEEPPPSEEPSPEVALAPADDSASSQPASPAPSPEPPRTAEGPAPPSPAPQSPAPQSPAAQGLPPSTAPRPGDTDKRSPDPKDKARLAIHLDPALQARSLRLWIDGKLLADEKLDPGADRKAALPPKVVSLSPGRRQVRVQVRTKEGLRSERLLVSFKAGSARRLDVKAGHASAALSFVLR